MNPLRTIFLVATVAAAVALTPVALAGTPTPAELKALEIRGQALDRQCDDPTLAREAFRALCGNAGAQSRPTWAELKALEIRGQGLNHLCDGREVASVAGYRAVCGGGAQLVTVKTASAPSPNGFDWADFGLGAGTSLGLALLFGGIAASVHYSRKGGVRPRTIS
jgi:hypothetical protein